MKSQATDAAPRALDTYGLTYAFTVALLIPGLQLIDKGDILEFSPAYLALIAGPFLLGPAIVFLFDSKDGLRTIALRILILSPLVAVTGLTFIFVAMIAILAPLGFLVAPENFAILSIISASIAVLLASPLAFSFVLRIREGISVRGLLQMGALLAGMVAVGWMISMTFDPGDTLGTFMRDDLVDHFVGAITWYLPALSLAAGLWRRVGLV